MTAAGTNDSHQAQVALWKLLQGENFTLDDLENLCFELGLNWDDLRGDNQPSKTRELVQHYAKRGQLRVLCDAIATARPQLRPHLNAIALPAVDAATQTAPTREGWHFPFTHLSAGNFTGRADERKQLTDWQTTDPQHPILVIRALGGFGKSELAWHWLTHDVDPAAMPRAMWWSFYETGAAFGSFLDSALAYLRVSLPPNAGPREHVDALLGEMSRAPALLVLDGFERELRAYSSLNAAYQGDADDEDAQSRGCVDPLAEHFLRQVASRPNLRAKVLMTTRLRPTALELRDGALVAGCREIELRQLASADAIALFRTVGIRGTRTEIEAMCAPYGYHPLSLRLLAGVVTNDPRKPGDIAVAARTDVNVDLVQQQHHVLRQAYDGLTPARQRLLGRLACLRAAVSYDVLAEIEKPATTLNADLRDLVTRGLVQRELARERLPDGDGTVARYDLHPIVRRYAYDRLTGDARAAAHASLRDYFAAVPKADKVQTLNDLAPVIELYHHMIGARQYDEAYDLFYDLLDKPIYYQLGAYGLYIELLHALFPDAEDAPPRVMVEDHQGRVLNDLGNAYSRSGQSRRAVQMKNRNNELRQRTDDKGNLAVGLANVAGDLLKIGELRTAEANLRQSIALYREIEDNFWEVVGHLEVGRLLVFRGAWDEAGRELDDAFERFGKASDVRSQGIVSADRAQRVLLMARQIPLPVGEGRVRELAREAFAQAQRALNFADERARRRYPIERDYVRAHWLLGAAQRLNREATVAERHLTEALTRCRRINLVEMEADILIDLARLRDEQGNDDEVASLLDEALTITERCEYVLQGADAHLELAKLALRRGVRATARDHAHQAHKLATCDGPPDYTYKVAYDEAGALLARLGIAPRARDD